MRPLEDVRILAVEQYGAGPFGSLHLAELGADVIRVETREGDVGRRVPPYAEDGDSLFYETFNRNKRGVVIDLRSRGGRRAFEDLVRESDAIYSNLRGDVVESLRLRYADLAPVNPRIVCCSLSGFGLTGPRRAEPAFDYMLQGLCGWMSLTGEPDGPPAKSGLSVVDYSSGLAAICALLAGLHAARRDGLGCDSDVSLFDTAISMLTYVATWQLTEGYPVSRQARSAHPTVTPFQMFETADGWIVAGGTKEKFWQSLAVVVERPDLLSDDRFVDFAGRLAHRDALTAELDDAFRRRGTAAWLTALSGAGVPCAPVNDVETALDDPQTQARGLVVTTDHPRFGTVRTVASPVRVGVPREEHRRAPQLDEHTDEVLSTLCGYSQSQLDALRQEGAIGADLLSAAPGD